MMIDNEVSFTSLCYITVAASHHTIACGYSVCSVPVVPLGVQFVSL